MFIDFPYVAAMTSNQSTSAAEVNLKILKNIARANCRKVGFSTEGHFAYISANLPISFKICKFSFSHDFYPFFPSK
jgi:hypothetical protein